MAPQFGATFVPGGFDDYYMPEVVAPAPQRVTPQVPQNMQDDLQRLELDARDSERRDSLEILSRHMRQSSLSNTTQQGTYTSVEPRQPRNSGTLGADGDIMAYQDSDSRAQHLNTVSKDAPSFSPFPKVSGDNLPPGDDAKEDILWNARKHVLHSQNVDMQISWARDVLIWAEIAIDAAAREVTEKPRPVTPRIEHELRVDALNIINYLAGQEHPDALYIRSKWLEFGKFGHRVDKREAYTGYKRAAELGNIRSEYRMGMLFEQSNDMSKAKEHYYRGMSLKDSAALYRMGMMSLLGQHGEPKDYSGGLERIKLAADSSDEDAPQGAYVYGMLLGHDLPDITMPDGFLVYNLETAKTYVEKAAYLGFAKAQLKMGQAYELCQLGCDFNPSYSLHYYGLAARQCLPEAALGVSRWFLFGYEGVFKKNEELAFKYAQEAAASKLPTGEFAMGYYYEIGIHVSQSLSEARKWYQLAADHGNKDATSRLDSLNHDQSLSKKDHETITLTRIKSQHGSQRGKRSERFKQPQKLPTLDENTSAMAPVTDKNTPAPSQPFGRASTATSSPRVSPQPSPGIRPTVVSDQVAFPDPSRASVLGTDRPPAFSIRLDSNLQAPMRPHSAAPYPDDDRPSPLIVNRPHSTAPYPEDDVKVPTNIRYGSGLKPLQKPHADRPSSSFGIKTHSPDLRQMPSSYSMGSLQPPVQASNPPGRVASAGWDPTRPISGHRHTPGDRPYTADDSYGRPASVQSHPGPNMATNKMQKQPSWQPQPPGLSNYPGPERVHTPRISSRPGSDASPQYDQRIAPQNYERVSKLPGASGRPERLNSTPHQDPSQPPKISRTGSAQPSVLGQRPAEPLALLGPGPKPPMVSPTKPAKGPATFEDMGIPQGKQEGDCVIM